jgi:ABC-2 type transport system permease protein
MAASSSGGHRRLRPTTLERWLVFVPRPVRHLAAKDIRLFVRDPAVWLQAGVFFGVLAVYVAGMRTTARGFSAPFWREGITVLNTAASLLVLAAVTTRFAFPLVSLEGRRFWLVGLAPVTRRLVVLEKFALTATAAALITVPLAAVSGERLGLAPAMLAASLLATLAASLALSGLAVGLGSLYPDFTAEDPSRIVSGLGGTLNLILSVGYVVAATAGHALVLAGGVHGRHAVAGSPGFSAAVLVILLAGSALVAWLPLRLGIASLERAEL